MNRYRPSLLLAVFFLRDRSVRLRFGSRTPAKLAAHWDKVTGSLKDHRNSAGSGKPAAAPRVADPRQRL